MKTEINLPNNIIINKVHKYKVAQLGAVIIATIIMIYIAAITEFDDDSLTPPIVTVATIVAIISSVIIAMSLNRKVYAPTGSSLRSVVVYFAESKIKEVSEATSCNRWLEIPKLAGSCSGTAMKLEVIYSEDLTFAAYQFFTYVPYSYQSTSQIFYIEKDDVKSINFEKLTS